MSLAPSTYPASPNATAAGLGEHQPATSSRSQHMYHFVKENCKRFCQTNSKKWQGARIEYTANPEYAGALEIPAFEKQPGAQ
jgi:hypothetical protein